MCLSVINKEILKLFRHKAVINLLHALINDVPITSEKLKNTCFNIKKIYFSKGDLVCKFAGTKKYKNVA